MPSAVDLKSLLDTNNTLPTKLHAWSPLSTNPKKSTQPPTGFGGLSLRTSLTKPIIAAVNGLCLGGGLELVLACDLVIAADTAVFKFPEASVGLAPFAGGAAMLLKTVGYQRCMELLITGKQISAVEAKEWGFVNEVTTGDQLMQRALVCARRVLKQSPDSVRAIKRAVHLALEEGWTDATRLSRQTKECKAMIEGDNFREGVLAFIEKRTPVWKALSKFSLSNKRFTSIATPNDSKIPPQNVEKIDEKAANVLFPGAVGGSFYTETLKFVHDFPSIPTYRVMDQFGVVLNPDADPQLPKETCLKMYKDMLKLNAMDVVMYEAQRQGRISFYMTSYGEEATHLGSAAALTLDDIIMGQYREAGVLLYRGFTISQFMNQCYSNSLDLGKGRQMPVHYGSKALNFQTISSPLGTQLPQAAGAAFGLKRDKKDACVVCYFGEGAASEGDFHAALNIASTIGVPVLFFCRNNGYAISTPAKEQYHGDGIASRGHGYGMQTIRVDGNDVFAVYNATKAARKICIEQSVPVLLEALTYRVGHHSTSDDSSAYRPKSESSTWEKTDSPIARFKKYLEAKSWWSETEDEEYRKSVRIEILKCFGDAEKVKKPSLDELFTDVYAPNANEVGVDGEPWIPEELQRQKKMLEDIMKKYPNHYDDTDYLKK
ncbi:hypothetical protein HK098_001930 [Nowakowskiella sp. JEL0407]|nr:hypothetical protein HK098_001930 [Nowakowskiella sp. JEL0407]